MKAKLSTGSWNFLQNAKSNSVSSIASFVSVNSLSIFKLQTPVDHAELRLFSSRFISETKSVTPIYFAFLTRVTHFLAAVNFFSQNPSAAATSVNSSCLDCVLCSCCLMKISTGYLWTRPKINPPKSYDGIWKRPNNLNVVIFNSARENLELFHQEKVKGIIIRVRARWHEHGEKSTKCFYGKASIK